MANELTLTLGANSVSLPIKGTQVQIRAGLRRYVLSQNVDIEGKTEAQIGKIAIWLMLNTARAASRIAQLNEAIEAERGNIVATVDSENNFLEPLESI